MRVTLAVNGDQRDLDLEPRRTLADTLREECPPAGVPLGCPDGTCGACTVLLNGEATRSCLVLGVQCDGAQVRTVEGLAFDPGLWAGLSTEDAAHREICVPGLVMLAAGGMAHDPDLSDDAEALGRLLASNVCGRDDHEQIQHAVVRAASISWLSPM